MVRTCTALHLRTDAKCTAEATSVNGLFCQLHSVQVQGLYLGYKRRSAELEALENTPPKCLPKNFAKTGFAGIESHDELREIHGYLSRKFNLVTRCVMARDLHHSHFYKDTSDYGHQVYLDRLRSSRTLLQQILHRVEKAAVHLLYRTEKWYAWVETMQAAADHASAAEKKKVKAEHALFKQHSTSIAKLREGEEARRREEDERKEVFDPIEDVIHDIRLGYIALIKCLIGQKVEEEEARLAEQRYNEMSAATAGERSTKGSTGKIRQRRINKEARKALDQMKQQYPSRTNDKSATVEDVSEEEEEKEEKEEEEDMNWLMEGIRELGQATRKPEEDTEEGDEYEPIIRRVAAVKEFLLLRNILASPSLLSTALTSESIDAFLYNSTHVRNTDLRDLALRLQNPSAELVRDAVADYSARERVGGDNHEGTERVKVCGIWVDNSSLKRPLPLNGWALFIFMTQCAFWTAAELCRSWKEFYALNIMVLTGMFDGISDGNWNGQDATEMMNLFRRLGCIAYAHSSSADIASGALQSTRKNRIHHAVQARNFLACNMSRDDPHSYRFIQLLQTYSSELICWAKDCLTGEILADPPADEKWLKREKQGTGRLDRGKWVVVSAMDKKWKAETTASRAWKLGFRGYYDIVIWDNVPGRSTFSFDTSIMHVLFKAFKIKSHFDAIVPGLEIYRDQIEEDNHVALERWQYIRERVQKKSEEADAKGQKPGDLLYSSIDEEIDRLMRPYDSVSRYLDRKDAIPSDVNKFLAMALDPLGKWRELCGEDSPLPDLTSRALMISRQRYVMYNLDEDYMLQHAAGIARSKDPKKLITGNSKGSEKEVESYTKEKMDSMKDMPSIEVWALAEAMAQTLIALAEDYAFAEPEDDETVKTMRKQMELLSFSSNRVDKLYKKGKNPKAERREAKKEQQEVMSKTFSSISANEGLFARIVVDMLWGNEYAKGLHELFRTDASILSANKGSLARYPAPRRPRVVPANVYEAWDEIYEKRKTKTEWSHNLIPDEWRVTIMKGIHRLHKLGVLTPSYETISLPTIAGKVSPDDPATYWFVDYRPLLKEGRLRSPKEGDPSAIVPPDSQYLPQELEKYERAHPGARYSLIRVLTDPDFWPSNLAGQDTANTCIADIYGRVWEWNKAPKDMPYAEWTMHDMLDRMFQGPKNLTPDAPAKDHVRYRVDTILVMADSDEICREWSTNTVALMYKFPWGLDVDLVRSFLNVDAQFLREIKPYLWE